MTILAAAFNGPTDYAIASDSTSDLDGSRVPSGGKVWRLGAILLGSHGLASQRQRAMRWTELRPAPADPTALVLALVDLYEHLAARVGPPPYAELPLMGLGVLVASPWGVMELDSGGAVTQPPAWAWWAAGSGGAAARGAIRGFTMASQFAEEAKGANGNGARGPFWGWSTSAIVRYAVEAAIDLDTGCGGAAVVLRSEAPPAADAPPRVGDTLLLPRRGRHYEVLSAAPDGAVLVRWRSTYTKAGADAPAGGIAGYSLDEWRQLHQDADAAPTRVVG
jgi:hypothetical protein